MVSPPWWVHPLTWWMSHHGAGRSHDGKMHPASRIRTARVWVGVARRVLRPMSKMIESPAMTTRWMVAPQLMRSRVAWVTGPTPSRSQRVRANSGVSPLRVATSIDDPEARRVTTRVAPCWYQCASSARASPRRSAKRPHPVGGIFRVGRCQMSPGVVRSSAPATGSRRPLISTQPSIVTDAYNRLRGWCSSWVSPAR